MPDQGFQDKTEPATPKKREEARKKGQVAKSREVCSVAVLVAGLLYLFFSVENLTLSLGGLIRETFLMIPLLQLDLSQTPVDNKNFSMNRTPGDVGRSLFRELLNESSRDSSEGNLALSLYQDRGPRDRNLPADRPGNPMKSLKEWDEDLGRLGNLSSHLLLNGTALPQLVSFLEAQGMNRERIDQLIRSASDGNGALHLDRLLAGLLRNGKEAGTGKPDQLIHSRDIPRVEEILFKMGLGAGEVKEVVERSAGRNGDLETGRLSSSLGKFFSAPVSEKQLTSLFERFDIDGKPGIMENGKLNVDLKGELQALYQTRSEAGLKAVKQELAALLRKDGILPQDVKSFLETLDVDFTQSLLKKTAPSSTVPADILDRAFIRSRPDWRKGASQEGIFEILRREGLLAQKQNQLFLNPEALINKAGLKARGDLFVQVPGAGAIQGEGNLHPDFGILPARAGKEAITGLFQRVSDRKSALKPEDAGQPAGPSKEIKGDLLGKDAQGADMQMLRSERAAFRVGSGDPSRSPHTLPEPLPAVADRMIWMVRAGEQKGRIVIHPPELGRLDLDLSVKHGHLQAQLSAENIKVKEILETNLNQLKEHLSDQGFIVDSLEVRVGLEDGRFREHEMQMANKRKGPFPLKESTTEPLAKGREAIGRPSGKSLWEIDLLV